MHDFNETETIKYFRNTFLSVKLIFCNEFYNICKKIRNNYDWLAIPAEQSLTQRRISNEFF